MTVDKYDLDAGRLIVSLCGVPVNCPDGECNRQVAHALRESAAEAYADSANIHSTINGNGNRIHAMLAKAAALRAPIEGKGD